MPNLNWIIFIIGLGIGAAPAWFYQGARIDAVQAKYDLFVEQVKSIGELAEADAKHADAINNKRKEKTDAELKKIAADNAGLAKRLRDARARGGYLPGAAAGASHPDRICFDRAGLESTMGFIDAGGAGIAEKGNAARLGLDGVKRWAQDAPLPPH